MGFLYIRFWILHTISTQWRHSDEALSDLKNGFWHLFTILNFLQPICIWTILRARSSHGDKREKIADSLKEGGFESRPLILCIPWDIKGILQLGSITVPGIAMIKKNKRRVFNSSLNAPEIYDSCKQMTSSTALDDVKKLYKVLPFH